MRTDPSVLLPSAAAASPAATAAADPPLDPPGVNSRRCGLRHRPKCGLSLVAPNAASSMLVLPKGTASAPRNRRTATASQSADAYARRETDDIEIVLYRKRNASQCSQRRALAPAAVQRRGGIARRCLGYREESAQFGTVARDALEVAVDGVARAHASRAHRRSQS